jgi:Icc-related predicted phosphoesterase
MEMAKDRVRIAALADVHFHKASGGTLQSLFRAMMGRADVFLLCGDLTDHGLPEEAEVLVRELSLPNRIPILAVLGNHDYHAGRQADVRQVLEEGGIRVLDGENCEVHGIGFAGVKGYIGGFGRRILEPWGEEGIKHLVQEAVEEALKLEAALSRLRTPATIALLHYAPIAATVEGEPLEIFPFLGCSRLEEPLNRSPVTAVFHGHAHHGQPEGKTSKGVPVYNVSLSLLRRAFPDRPPYHLLEIPRPKEVSERKYEKTIQ